jgi:hypothetical protein
MIGTLQTGTIGSAKMRQQKDCGRRALRLRLGELVFADAPSMAKQNPRDAGLREMQPNDRPSGSMPWTL